MAAIAGTSTITNALNYPGDYANLLYGLTPEDTPFLAMAGGLNGGESCNATIFGWQTYDLRDASQPDIAEGAANPAATGRTRSFAFNIVQIHMETVATTWTRQAVYGEHATTGSAHAGSVGLAGGTPVMDEHAWQLEQMLKQINRDVNYSFVNGTFDQPADSATGRRTRGMIEAISTNTDDQGTAITNCTATFADDIVTKVAHGLVTGDQVIVDSVTPTTSGISVGDVYFIEKIGVDTFYLSTSRTGVAAGRKDITTANLTDLDITKLVEPTQLIVLDMMQEIYDNGGLQEGETRTIFCGSGLKRYLTKLFITDMGFRQTDRTVGGVNCETFVCDFGKVNLVLERMVPKEGLLIASMEQVAPVWLERPGKGRLYMTRAGQAGAYDSDVLYGEVGLRYGNEKTHGYISGLHGLYNPS
jgi:hypothetical protein